MARPPMTEQIDQATGMLGDMTAAERCACILVALAHANRDRDVWGSDRAFTFWDRFPNDVRAACCRGPTLGHWWEAMTRRLGAHQPGKAEDRQLLAATLAEPAGPVLDVLRGQAEVTCLRVRLVAQHQREQATDDTPTTTQEEML